MQRSIGNHLIKLDYTSKKSTEMTLLSTKIASIITDKRNNQCFITLCLIIFLPVFATDFVISGGFVPISYILFYSVIWPHPILCIYIIISAIYALFFYGSAKFICYLFSKKTALQPIVSIVILASLIFLSSKSIYMDIGHNASHEKTLFSLYEHQFKVRFIYPQK